MSEWVYYAKAAKFWGMNPKQLRLDADCDELTLQAWDLMAIEAKAETLACEIAEVKAKQKVKVSGK